MDNPTSVPTPANVAATVTLKTKLARDADKQRNREISHMLKTSSLHRPMVTRSVPHARGR